MSGVASLLERLALSAIAATLLTAAASDTDVADPCVQSCRTQHNACRMAAKLLLSSRCDAQLQSCISECFAAGRFRREQHDLRPAREFRDLRGPH
jgi:hypothetical protein